MSPSVGRHTRERLKRTFLLRQGRRQPLLVGAVRLHSFEVHLRLSDDVVQQGFTARHAFSVMPGIAALTFVTSIAG